MVIAQREVYDGTDGDGICAVFVVDHEWLFGDTADAHDGHVRLVDDGQAEDGSKLAGVGDGEGCTFDVSRKEAEALIIDCTEQPIHRPGDDAVQKRHYSGKKKRHTLKSEYIVTKKGRIASVSPSHPGSRHDLAVRRSGPKLPKGARAYGDSAYQGYDKDHKAIDYPYNTNRP